MQCRNVWLFLREIVAHLRGHVDYCVKYLRGVRSRYTVLGGGWGGETAVQRDLAVNSLHGQSETGKMKKYLIQR